jgi:hypothetical protein
MRVSVQGPERRILGAPIQGTPQAGKKKGQISQAQCRSKSGMAVDRGEEETWGRETESNAGRRATAVAEPIGVQRLSTIEPPRLDAGTAGGKSAPGLDGRAQHVVTPQSHGAPHAASTGAGTLAAKPS